MATTEWRPVLAFPMGPSPPAPLPEAGRGGEELGGVGFDLYGTHSVRRCG